MGTSNNLFDFEQIDVESRVYSTLIFEEIRKELEEYLTGQSADSDLTDGVFDLLAMLSDKIQEEFDELMGGDSDKKRFLRVLTTISTLLLNTKVDTADKIKRIPEITVKTLIELCQ